ncbi:uncharacterized protein LOC130551973 isoform X2 [Triplophysa rosa]|uniref:uncharacterized protein LOC130551973 isoform X2 n=1 Tax=Triplophysa rosa TaxID=992332 RepID=UPI002545D91C|nr:uncharacterized protein LOC130551973 isoform X2 [Triplophysa rosa]
MNVEITLYLTMADNIKELNEVIRKGRAVAATLEDIHDRTQLDAFVKKGHTAKLDVGQIVKEGQTIIEILDYESSRNHLNHVLKESIELLGKANQNGPKAKKRRIQSNGRVRCKLRKKSCPQQAKPSTSHDSRLKSRACPEPTERRQDQGPVHDSLLHELQELLSAVSCNLRSEGTPHSASMHWGTRTAASPERWGEARPSLINNRLATEQIEGQLCLECRYELSLPHLHCEKCRETWVPGVLEMQKSGYWPATMNFCTIYDEEVFMSFKDLKMAASGLSRLAFIRMLDMKTVHYGRNGTLCGDTFLKSFFEWSICLYEVDKICGDQHFMCPACTPLMLAVAVDGNRKLHRFKKAGNSEDSGYFEGLFLCKDDDVSSFVQYIRRKVQHVGGKGVCGSAEFTASKEFSRKTSSKLDEEGIEVGVCRHGVLLRALNMFRGEIYAYPLYLQKELWTENATFFCADIMCKYWPYLKKVCQACPELRHLLNMKPFLSVMHAKVHGVKCEIKWSGSFQKGAAYTMGEEVEQANSFLSRIGISTKFMSKAGRTDLLTLQCMGWNKMKTQNMCQTICTRYQKTQQNLKKETESLQDMKKEQCVEDGVLHQWVTDVQEWAHTTTVGDSDAAIQPIRNTIEELSLCIKQRQHRLYRHTATNKGRNKIRRKINEERKKLASSIDALVDPSFKIVSIEEVLQNDLVFPWQLTEQDDVNLLTKKKVFDKVMLIQRLEEEQTVLVQEAKQHWLFLRSQEHKLNSLLDTIISGVNPWNLPDDGIQGLQCVLKRKLHELRAHQDSVKTSYQAIDTITEHFTVEECEYPSWAEPSGALYSSSTDLSSDEDDEDDTFLL